MMSTISQKDAYLLMLQDYPDVMNIQQIGEVLDISDKTVYKLLREQKLASIKVGKAYRIPKIFLFAYLNICTEEADETDDN